jgi:SWI/SNF-related matrix-associated actin-dependent regulator 1 of chromatin subfamily A
MGTGKTRQTLAAIASMGAYPALIVCPANVKYGWTREAEKLGLEPPLVISTKKPDTSSLIAEEDGIVIVNYDIIAAWQDVLMGAKTVAFDEAQMLSNERSQRSKAAKAIAHKASHRIALSGTPLMNTPKELWNIVDTISPYRFGKAFNFYMRYCGAHQEEIKKKNDNGEEEVIKKVWNFDGASCQDELAERMKFFMLRRTKHDVKLELPPKTRELVELDVTADYHNPDRWWSIDNKNQAQVALGIAGQLKIPAAADLARRHVEDGSNVVLFSYKKDIARGLQKELAQMGLDSYLATGDETHERRRSNAERARETGAVLCATIDAMGTGVDYLSYANVIIFVELHYVPMKLLQAEDRAHRSGQENNVFIYYLVALGTIDEIIRDRIRMKLTNFEGAIGSTGETLRDDLMGETEEEALAAVKALALEMQARYQ